MMLVRWKAAVGMIRRWGDWRETSGWMNEGKRTKDGGGVGDDVGDEDGHVSERCDCFSWPITWRMMRNSCPLQLPANLYGIRRGQLF